MAQAVAKEKSNEYLIYENPVKALFIFAIPMIIGNVFQQIYNLADGVVVGNFVGENALAAVGASGSLTQVFINIAVGAGVGASVLVSRYFGSREYQKMKSCISTSLLFFLGLSIVLAVIGVFSGRTILTWLRTPEEVMDMAVLYLKIYFIGFPFLFMYNILASIFNAVGNSKIPTILLIISSILNIVLDVWFVAGLGMGVFGVALATLIAQGISAVISFLIFLKLIGAYKEKFTFFHFTMLRKMLSLAIPSIIQQTTVSVGLMLVQSAVNAFGAQALAGYSSAVKVEGIFAAIFTSIGNAASPFVSQNLGAGKKERVQNGYHAALILDLIFAAITFVLLFFFSKPIAALFLTSNGTDMAFRVAMGYMKCLGCFYILMGIKMATDGVLRGIGYMKIFMLANLVNLFIRVMVATICSPLYGVAFVWYASPIGWLVNFVISYSGYRRIRKRGFQVGEI